MDTYKDAVVLNDLWAGGDPPWRVWSPDTEAPEPVGESATGGSDGR